ncbi:MAG: hypothetical protein IJ608_05725 [Lachnospiraceae bacterium]|nr:hypothetical protein [Lachnospiraceae bacterium]
MATVSEVVSSAIASTQNTQQTSQTKSSGTVTSKAKYGKTIGEPKLSEAAEKTYNELKKKYSGQEFILVGRDKINEAKLMAGNLGNKDKLVVLIDEDKLEKMATDENYRKEIEGKIDAANKALPQLQAMMQKNGNVAGIGMQFTKDNRTEFFALVDKGNKDLNAKIEAKRAEKKAAKKAADKKAAKKEQEEKIKEKRESKAEDKKDIEDADDDIYSGIDKDRYEVITASSVEELARKLEDYNFSRLSDSVLTETEKSYGQNVDFRV